MAQERHKAPDGRHGSFQLRCGLLFVVIATRGKCLVAAVKWRNGWKETNGSFPSIRSCSWSTLLEVENRDVYFQSNQPCELLTLHYRRDKAIIRASH